MFSYMAFPIQKYRGFVPFNTYKGVAYIEIVGKSSLEPLVFCHGNGYTIEDCTHYVQKLAKKTKRTVIAWDYPGYGASEGEPNVTSCREALDKILERSGPCVLIGHSIGTGVILDYCANTNCENKVRQIILINPFVSVRHVAFRDNWFLRFITYPLDFYNNDINIVKAKDKVENISIFSGMQDEMIPFTQGYYLAMLDSNCSFFIVDGCDHNNTVDYFVDSINENFDINV